MSQETATRCYVCQVVACEAESEAGDSSPICGARRDNFLQVDGNS